MSKKTVKAAIERLDEGSAVLQELESILNGAKVPFTPGATKPEMPEIVEPDRIAGKPNPMWFVALRTSYVKFNRDWWRYYGTPWPQFESTMKVVHSMAREQGLDRATLSPESVSLQEIKRVDDIFEMTAEKNKRLEDRILGAYDIALEQLPAAKKKRWAKTLRHTRRLQGWCRNEAPTPDRAKKRMHGLEIEAWENTHTLRYMLWTMRSTLLTKDGMPDLILIPAHLVMACLVVSLARRHHVERRIDGVLIQLPPGHFKSWYCIGDRALELNKHAERPAAFLHYVADTAAERYRACRKHFDDNDEVGRRRRALFPEVEIDRRKSRSEAKHWLKVDGKLMCGEYEEGVLTSYGVHESAQGKGLLELSIDDPSDEKESVQIGTREATNKALEHTWMQRLRGLHSFFVMICTAWHEDDFASKLIKDIRAGKINVSYYAQACGGNPHFTPICPEICDRRMLRKKWVRLGPADYARIYQNNPASVESRRITRLHYYDYELWENLDQRKKHPEWEDFFASAEYYLTVDPSGTEGKRSNLAGAMLAANGRLRITHPTGVPTYMPKLVFVGFISCRASQLHLSDQIVDTIRGLEREPDAHRIHRVLIESTGGYHATAEHLEERHGFPTNKIVRMPPGVGTKVAKLIKHGAVLLERGDVLFPGRHTKDERGQTVLEIIPSWSKVGEQLLQAGTVKDDNLLDCVRQICEELGPRIFKTREAVDDAPKRNEQQSRITRRKHDMFASLMKPKKRKGRQNMRLLQGVG
jgi:hypothetical protein